MNSDKDINGLRAQSWFKPSVSELKKTRFDPSSDNRVFFEKVKDIIRKFIYTADGDQKSELKYVFIANMLVSRIRTAIGKKLTDGIDSQTICDQLVDAISGIQAEDQTTTAIEKIDYAVTAYSSSSGSSTSESEQTVAQNINAGSGKNDINEIASDFSDAKILVYRDLSRAMDRLDDLEYSGLDLGKSIAHTDGVFNLQYAETRLRNRIKQLKLQINRIDINKKINEAIQRDAKSDNKKKKKSVAIDFGLLRRDRDGELMLASTGDHSTYIDQLNKNIRLFDKVQLAGILTAATPLLDKKHDLLVELEKMTSPWRKLLKYIFRKIKDNVFDRISKKIRNKLFKSLKKRFPKLSKLFRKFRKIFTKAKRLITRLKRAMKGIFSKIKRAVRYIGRKVKRLIKQIRSLLKGIWKGIKAFWDMIKKPFLRILDFIKNKIRALLRGIMRGIRYIIDIVWKGLQAIGRFLGRIASWIGEGLSRIGKWFLDKLKPIGDLLKNGWNRIGNAFNKVRDFAKNTVNKVKNAFSKVGDFFKNAKKKIADAVKNAISKAKNVLKGAIEKVAGAVKNVVQKVVTKVASVVRGLVVKVLRKIGIDILKKRAAKTAGKMGIKFLVKWFSKFLVKLIAKVSVKLAASAAANAAVGPGQVISAILLIYTIYDTISTLLEIYFLFKENPELWGVVKDEVAKWIMKSLNFVKGMCEAGWRIYKAIYIDAPKAVGHWIGDKLFNSNKVTIKLKEEQTKQLESMTAGIEDKYLKIGRHDRLVLFKDNIDKNGGRIPRLIDNINKIIKLIAKEEDRWIRDSDLIQQLLTLRHRAFMDLIKMLADMGIFIKSDFYNVDRLKTIKGDIKEVSAYISSRLTEIHSQLLNDFRENAQLNIRQVRKEWSRMGDEQKNVDVKTKELAAEFAELKDVAVKKLHFAA